MNSRKKAIFCLLFICIWYYVHLVFKIKSDNTPKTIDQLQNNLIDQKTIQSDQIKFKQIKNEQILIENSNLSCDKWIVITSISLPTDDVKYIHDASFDWCVVVVADKKTPTNWAYKNIVFLSVEKQMKIAEQLQVYKNNL